MSAKDTGRDTWSRLETVLTHGGRDPSAQFGFVNTPVTRGSTVIYPDLATLKAHSQRFHYGRMGNPNSEDVETVVTALEGAAGTRLTPNGLAAITTALLAVLSAGDRVLVSDSVYGPTRRFCNNMLSRLGIETEYFDPRIGAGLAEMMTANTKAVFLESPGSLTFEINDLPAIAAVARTNGAAVIIDNSWATPLYYKPLSLGADIVVHAATKMFIGHSDALTGTVSANEAYWPAVADTHRDLGMGASPDDLFLVARGLRTLAVRMKEHQARAIEMARWLEGQDLVERVIHPALESHPDHGLFKRDFTGSGSLFAFVLKPAPEAALAALVDNMALFSMGYSWGGYESLLVPTWPGAIRTAVPWTDPGQAMRIHVGFEDMDDLKQDLSEGFARYAAKM